MAIFIKFTKEDLEIAREIPLWQERLEWLRECASRPDRPHLVHRAWWDDASAHAGMRDGVENMRKEFYERGTLTPMSQAVVTLLYQATVY